ncbi:MAG: AraC family transcriptional regulator [Sphingomonas sp.]|jgi:AraC-like DNA-binding protein|nr:AraC family transcriptional regulator [Sphingomonas sp.]
MIIAGTKPDNLPRLSDQGGLRNFRVFDSCDVDETRERIAQIMQPHVLRPLAPLARHRGCMNYASIGRVGLGTIRFGRMLVDVESISGYHLLVFCLSGHARLALATGEVIVQGSRGVCVAPGEPFRGEFSEDCEQLVIKIERGALDGLLERRRLRLKSTLDFASPTALPWTNVIRTLTSDPNALFLVHNDRQIAASYERLLLNLLVASEGIPLSSSRNSLIAPFSVRRAEDFMRSNLAYPIRLPDIAEAAKVPVRTLLDGFQRFRDQSPMQFLRNLRLDHARSLLERDRCDSVTQVALESGLTHLGRFARDYRSRFGETPSDTRSSPR